MDSKIRQTDRIRKNYQYLKDSGLRLKMCVSCGYFSIPSCTRQGESVCLNLLRTNGSTVVLNGALAAGGVAIRETIDVPADISTDNQVSELFFS